MWAPPEVGSLSDQHVGWMQGGLQGEAGRAGGGQVEGPEHSLRALYLIGQDMTRVSGGSRDTASVC